MKKKRIIYLLVFLLLLFLVFVFINPTEFIHGFREGLNATGR